MRWFEGNIAEAVAKSKAMNAIFIVFVEGADDMSRELSGALEAAQVSSRLEDKEKFLSVKLSSASENYTHFAQIYKIVPVPSVFFIGRDGAPLEVVCGGITVDKLSERIDNILRQYYNQTGSTVQGLSPGTSSSSSSSQAFLQAESQEQSKQEQAKSLEQSKQEQAKTLQAPAVVAQAPLQENKEQTKSDEGPTAAKQIKTDAEYEVVCDGDVCVKRPKSISQETSAGVSTEQMVTEAPPSEQPPLDSRLERAKEILEAKRKEKAAKEKELERQKELERRATGQGVAELKRWQHEQELKDAAEERRRERLANELARQRVLEQIAQDRAERRARLNPAPAAADVGTAQRSAPSPSVAPAAASGQVRIQLKLADGTSHAASFSADDTLADIHKYIIDNRLVQSNRAFTLWTTFPRRDLPSGADTLLSQGLAPSAALLVLPAGGAGAAEAPAALPQPVARVYTLISTVLTTLVLQPLAGVWSWLSLRLFPPTSGRDAPPGQAPGPQRAAAARREPGPQHVAAARRSASPGGLRHRPASNIHLLREDRSSDDENNTWNGNSTQQM